MIIGLDFDNTIVCYDKAIAILADQMLSLPAGVPRTKNSIRDYFRRLNKEDTWTRFQGELYGPGMDFAEAYPGFFLAAEELRSIGFKILVISHRTRFPYLGQKYDLHLSAKAWLQRNLHSLIGDADVIFNEQRVEKINCIKHHGCDVFVDDLSEILLDAKFPSATRGILFSPNFDSCNWHGEKISEWLQLPRLLKKYA